MSVCCAGIDAQRGSEGNGVRTPRMTATHDCSMEKVDNNTSPNVHPCTGIHSGAAFARTIAYRIPDVRTSSRTPKFHLP
jgi:hypothetical protein